MMKSHVEQLIRRLERLVLNENPEFTYCNRNKKKTEKGEFGYIPLSVSLFCKQLETVAKLIPDRWNRDTRLSFCEVGCGLGSKLFLAGNILYPVHLTGIEITPSYLRAAKKLLSGWTTNITFIRGDARKQDYSSYDIIYFYSPMIHGQGEAELEEQIANTAKKGAYILANFPAKHWDKDDRFKAVNLNTYRKVK